MPRSLSYDEYLVASLKNPKEAEAYLNAALDDEDPRVFLLALRDVAEARGGRKVIRQNLSRLLARRGDPGLRSLGALLSRLGFRLSVEPKRAA